MYVLVVGGGQIGGHVAHLLLASGCQVTIIEPREAALARVRQDSPGSLIVAGSGTDPAVLEARRPVRTPSTSAMASGI